MPLGNERTLIQVYYDDMNRNIEFQCDLNVNFKTKFRLAKSAAWEPPIVLASRSSSASPKPSKTVL
jgi:hypothetical protein